jgi:hypothetical protein
MVGDAKGHHRADPGVGDTFDLARQIIFPECASRRHGFDGLVVIDLFFEKPATPDRLRSCCLFKHSRSADLQQVADVQLNRSWLPDVCGTKKLVYPKA